VGGLFAARSSFFDSSGKNLPFLGYLSSDTSDAGAKFWACSAADAEIPLAAIGNALAQSV
jgi:hypothetical protein